MTSEPQHGEGRVIRWAENHPGTSNNFANAIEDIYNDQLDAIVLRQAFPADASADALQRINNDTEVPWLRPNRTGPSANIRVLGVAATASFETPGGPAVDAYFENADRFERVTKDLFEDLFVAQLSRLAEHRSEKAAYGAQNREPTERH